MDMRENDDNNNKKIMTLTMTRSITIMTKGFFFHYQDEDPQSATQLVWHFSPSEDLPGMGASNPLESTFTQVSSFIHLYLVIPSTTLIHFFVVTNNMSARASITEYHTRNDNR